VITAPGPVERWTMADWERRLCAEPPTAVFGHSELAGLPAPVRRYFHAAIAEGTPLATGARFRMRGHIKVGRWLPFRAQEIIDPHVGFVWTARAAGVIAGSDHYLDGVGAMRWKLAGLVDVATGDGPDISRSGAGRCGIEGILLPTAMLPRTGVTWTAEDDEHISAHHRVGSTSVEIRLTLDDVGLVRSVVMSRWGDPDATGTWGWYPFGGEITGPRTFGGLTIPGAGRLGWHAGTDRWSSGEFFRYEITSFDVPAAAGAAR
jgi:hypothetical protein